jgi:ornithine cyclodeaminase/alanine dehydrogenase-like protein (mu-crystallin family)
MGLLVKSATVFPGNAGRGAPSINGGVSLFSDLDGTLEAILDFHLVTKWKTAGDSLLAALKLAPKDTRTILIVGAGTVARSLREAYGAAFPEARFLVWNRSRDAEAPGLVVSRYRGDRRSRRRRGGPISSPVPR